VFFTCLEGKGDPENARLSLVAEDETVFEHVSETDKKDAIINAYTSKICSTFVT